MRFRSTRWNGDYALPRRSVSARMGKLQVLCGDLCISSHKLLSPARRQIRFESQSCSMWLCHWQLNCRNNLKYAQSVINASPFDCNSLGVYSWMAFRTTFRMINKFKTQRPAFKSVSCLNANNSQFNRPVELLNTFLNRLFSIFC